jgi:hypothetical protein
MTFEKRKGVTDLGQNVDAFEKPNLSPEDEGKHYADLLASAMESTGLVEIVETKVSVGQIHFMCRVQKKNEKEFAYSVLKPTLLAARGSFDLFTGKQFFIKKGTDEMVFGWVFAVGSMDLTEAVRTISTILEVAAPQVMVTEAPLMGPPTPSGSVGKGGRKGAAPLSSEG